MFRYKNLFLVLIALGVQAYSEDICGIIDIPTTLTKAKSPYRLVGDLYISPVARLTLEAGTTILVVPGEACGDTRQYDWADSNMVSIKVEGAFYVSGTPDDPVTIVPENHKPGRIEWDGIRIQNKSSVLVQIENLRIAGAQRALFIKNSRFHISNSLFFDNNTGVWLEEEADVSLYNNLFTKNRSAALSIKNSNPSIVANIFYENPNYGIQSDSRPKPRIEYNLFYKSGDEDCWRCPAGIAQLTKKNDHGDSVDNRYNMFQDPIFMGSVAESLRKQKDPAVPTPAQQARDSVLQQMYAKSDSLGKTGLQPVGVYKPLGRGQWRLSRYSPALDAAPDNEFFLDANGTRGDIGLFGGKIGRTRGTK